MLCYKRVHLQDLHREGYERQDARVESDSLLFDATHLQIPSIGFGTCDPTSLNLTEHEQSSWNEQTLHLPEVHRFRIRNALVHPPYGIVTVDDLVLQETLAHIPFHLPGYFQNDQEVAFPEAGIGGSFKDGLHVMGGNYSNHYHWLLDIVPKLQIDPLARFAFDGTIMMPPATSLAQQDMLARLLLINKPVMSLTGNRAIQVESLLFIPNLVGYGFSPNPGLASFFDRLRRFLEVDEPSVRRVYVIRKDSKNRVLINEDEVIALVERYGFEPVLLSTLNLAEQARLFASASHIIAPHGAGLANLPFCNAGIAICELHMNGYLNWCFRRLGGTRNVSYGCVVGNPEAHEQTWMHSLQWSVPLAQLEAVLNDPRFMRHHERDSVPASTISAGLALTRPVLGE